MIATQYLRSVHLRRGDVPSWDEYPFHLPAVRSLKALELRSRTARASSR